MIRWQYQIELALERTAEYSAALRLASQPGLR